MHALHTIQDDNDYWPNYKNSPGSISLPEYYGTQQFSPGQELSCTFHKIARALIMIIIQLCMHGQ